MSRLVFLAGGLLATTAAAGEQDTWGYVVSAEHVKGTYKHPTNDCRVTGKVPAARPAPAPAPGDESSLKDATAFSEIVFDPFERCEDYRHTWQAVRFRAGDRSRPTFASWPTGRVSFSFVFGAFALLFAVGAFARQRWWRPKEPG